MNLASQLPSIIKSVFILLCSIYTYRRILNIPFSRRTSFSSIVFSILVSPVVCYIRINFPLYTVLIMTFLVSLFCYIQFRNNISQTLCMSILSIGSSYALFALTALLTLPIDYFLLVCKLPNPLLPILLLTIIGVLQNLFIHLIFRSKRLCSGIPSIVTILSGDTGVFLGALLILFTSTFFITRDTRNRAFHLLLIAFIIALGIIIWLWWQKTIQTDYINKNNFQQIDILESKLQERDAELERLSKIIHKDNKLLAALELSTRELLTDTASEKAQSLLQELNRFSKERSETLHAYESGPATLPETGLFSVDTMIRYLHQRALKHRIDFQLSLEGELAGITDVISEAELRTIIADLGENAIIATRESETKNIRLSMERKTDGYALYFYDSGEPFAKEVLENLGKKRYTTHAETGGSGIGLMTTSELVAKHHGEFFISDEEIPLPYTKCVVVKLLIP